MSATIREIVNQALTVVGEVSGPGVQMYEDDRMKADAVRAFNMMFKKYPWQQYLKWFTVALDGVSGRPSTGPFNQVLDFEDFVAVHRDGRVRSIAHRSDTYEPCNTRSGGTGNVLDKSERYGPSVPYKEATVLPCHGCWEHKRPC